MPAAAQRLAQTISTQTPFNFRRLEPLAPQAKEICAGLGYFNWDTAISKPFPLGGERVQLHFRAEYFNVFNRANFNGPQVSLSGSGWTPIDEAEPVYPEAARAQNVHGVVNLLVTLDPQARVTHAEVLSGPQVLRAAAIEAVKQWKSQPVIRDGVAVSTLTNATVEFSSGQSGAEQDLAGLMAVPNRRMQLEKELPRSPQQILTDLEQDSEAGDDTRQFYMLDEMTKAALRAGAFDKAAEYAKELLSKASQNPDDVNYGNAIHDGDTVLGRLALRQGDVKNAGRLLLEAGRTPGSTQLNSFGPDMTLARDLLEKGEREVVLQYLTLCGHFWTAGAQRLQAWSKTVRQGGIPEFGSNLR